MDTSLTSWGYWVPYKPLPPAPHDVPICEWLLKETIKQILFAIDYEYIWERKP